MLLGQLDIYIKNMNVDTDFDLSQKLSQNGLYTYV
jgi:hypothetical protein